MYVNNNITYVVSFCNFPYPRWHDGFDRWILRSATPHGIGRLIINKILKKVIASHIGTNSGIGREMNKGEIGVELTPQGTLVEKIRSGGARLGGFLTTTEIGIMVEESNKKRN